MSQINLSGMSLDEFCEKVINICGLDSQLVEDTVKTDIANYLGIDYSSVTYAFVYLSDLYKTFEDASDDENDDEMVILDAIRQLNETADEDYFIVFND